MKELQAKIAQLGQSPAKKTKKEVLNMVKLYANKFFSMEDLKHNVVEVEVSVYGWKRYKIEKEAEAPCLKFEEELGISKLWCEAMLNNKDGKCVWVYYVDGDAFLVSIEIEPYDNKKHKLYQISVSKEDEEYEDTFNKLGFIKTSSAEVFTIMNGEEVGEFIKKLLRKGWSLRF
jgi:hypothetical protein